MAEPHAALSREAHDVTPGVPHDVAVPSASDARTVHEGIDRACARIAPAWPLDRLAAVNPLWGFVDRPIEETSARLGALAGTRLSMPREWYRDRFLKGGFGREHLEAALAEAGAPMTTDRLITLLYADPEPRPPRALVTDVADAKRDLIHQMAWREHVVDRVSQLCASYFDAGGQAQIGPIGEGLYATWREHLRTDRSTELLMGLRSLRALSQELPSAHHAAIEGALLALDVPREEHVDYLTALLLDVNGWASYCAYRRWTARLDGGEDDHIVELLAIRLAWEQLLHRAGGPTLARRWQVAMAAWPTADRDAEQAQRVEWLAQRAMEIAYQRRICATLPAGFGAARAEAPAVQAAFCIDVRSEIFRRALEAESDAAVQTLGFAGFFGMPIEYLPVAGRDAIPQLPGLLAPSLRATDLGVAADLGDDRRARLAFADAWRSFKSNASGGFSFVESTGLFYAAKLLANSFGRARPSHPDRAGLTDAEHRTRKPRLTGARGGGAIEHAQRCDLAAGILRAMSLTGNFARVVALIGHGSETVNNPYAAGLDCGACCGHSGEVNARAVAALLNEPEVRAGLAERGLDVPETTLFVAGLHNTTTDAIVLFDLDEVPSSHDEDLGALRGWLDAAGDRARAERAPTLGLEGLAADALKKLIGARARDWSEVRPEWGLANNAAFVVAPRERTQHMSFEGRSFLHDYRHEEDESGAVLELIMTAPMVVTHWINLQYYASTVDNELFGSGNKVLHNVVGGHLGVFEGNGGDLRIGLPLQSLHDGDAWVHTPLRLSVFIEAPRDAIDSVIEKHDLVRQLVENGWIHLFQLDGDEVSIHARRADGWTPA